MYVPNPHTKPDECRESIYKEVDSAYMDSKLISTDREILLGQLHVILGQRIEHLRERGVLYDYLIKIEDGFEFFFKLTKTSEIEEYVSPMIRRDIKLKDLLDGSTETTT